MENNLPKGWIECLFGDVVKIQNGYAFPSKDFKRDKGVPLIKQSQLSGDKVDLTNCVFLDESYLRTKPEFILKKGDVLIGMSGSIGKLCTYDLDIPALQNQRTGKVVLKCTDDINKRFIWHFLTTIELQLLEKGKGLGVANVSADDIESLPFLLPPLQEQQRIVEKLDALMARISNSKTRLEKIPTLLKNFRQSVLAAAVSGEGEEEVTENVCDEIQIGPFGTQLHKHDYISNGIPLVNPNHIQGGKIVPDLDLTVSKTKYKELTNYHLKVGDVIMGRRGEMARCALVNEKENGWLCGTGSLFFRPNLKKVHPEYLYWALSSQNTKTFLEGESKGTTMSNLNLTIVKTIPIILPSLKEQKEIVRKVEELFHFADSIETRYQKAKAWFDKLPQSILAKAFRGELVPQNENDEPASELLKRIQQAKQTNLPAGKAGHKPSSKAKRRKMYEDNDELSLVAEE